MKVSFSFLVQLTFTTREFVGRNSRWNCWTQKRYTEACSVNGYGDNYIQMLLEYGFPRLAEVADIDDVVFQ